MDSENLDKGELIERISHIKEQSRNLIPLLWTQEEIKDHLYNLNQFQQKINHSMQQIIRNLYWYEKREWKKFHPNKSQIDRESREKQWKKEKERMREWWEENLKYSHFYLDFKVQVEETIVRGMVEEHGWNQFEKLRIVDVGCGDAGWLRKLIAWGASPEKMLGIEFNSRLVERAKTQVDSVQFRYSLPGELPLEDQKFDLILILGVLMHILDESFQKKIAQELLNHLNKNGIILTANLLKERERQLDPYLSYTTKGLGLAELERIFPRCQISYQEKDEYGIAIISKKMNREGGK
ncbi:class I SAM-dependent methyltransferase [Caldalkalibacillus mannanilyticus]|uniref:class I SAM-dependent methyltransferase n=1 Tax=Caldalkalibacillus mannanilyticus TaxID=1418 RepID=UPI000468260E|nr:class I SAM-dependent methyltransferase [Caldalkalibacillus mannanilyticus]